MSSKNHPSKTKNKRHIHFQYTFDRARTIYGYESLPVAHAHRALSRSLITLASMTYSKENSLESNYLHHAHEAFRIAQDWFGVEDRIRLFPFKMTLAHAQQAHISSADDAVKESSFNEAMELLDECSLIAQEIFGSMSFKVAQVHRLRSATFLSKKM